MSQQLASSTQEAMQKISLHCKRNTELTTRENRSDEPHTVNTWIPGVMDRFLYDHMYLLIPRLCSSLHNMPLSDQSSNSIPHQRK